MLHHTGTQTIETERLILRRFTVEDAANMFKNWANSESVTAHLTWSPHPNVESCTQLLRNWVSNYANEDYYEWAIELKEIGEPIGGICLCNMDSLNENAEIGYCIGEAFWGKGIMTEAAKAVLNYGFETIGLVRVLGRHATGNPASGRVMQKCGFEEEGIQRKSLKNGKGILEDCKCYGLINEK